MRSPDAGLAPGAASLPFRHRALRFVQSALYRSRALDRLPPRPGATVLLYHSVAPAEAARYVENPLAAEVFERQIAFLAHHRHVVALSALAAQLGRGQAPAPGTVVVTFDDGYRDNAEVAAPILRRYGVAATIFLATAYVARGENQWADRLHTTFTTRTRQRCQLGPSVFDLGDDQQRRTAFGAYQQYLLEATYPEREPILARLEDELRPAGRAPRLTLTWDDVRMLADRYPEVEIGVHTAHHVDLARASEDIVRAELRQSMDDVEEATGIRPRHFSFPYGRVTPAAVRLVAEAGLETAMGGTGGRPIEASADPHQLWRLDASLSWTQSQLRTHPSFGSLPSVLTKGR